MIYICIALVIISTEYFAFMWWKESRKPVQEPNKELLDRIENLEDQVSGLKMVSGLKRRE